jgi:hypothetical protein
MTNLILRIQSYLNSSFVLLRYWHRTSPDPAINPDVVHFVSMGDVSSLLLYHCNGLLRKENSDCGVPLDAFRLNILQYPRPWCMLCLNVMLCSRGPSISVGQLPTWREGAEPLCSSRLPSSSLSRFSPFYSSLSRLPVRVFSHHDRK